MRHFGGGMLFLLIAAGQPSDAVAQFRNAFNIRFQNIRFENQPFNGFAFRTPAFQSQTATEIRFQNIPFRGLDSVLASPAEEDAGRPFRGVGFRGNTPPRRAGSFSANSSIPTMGQRRERRPDRRSGPRYPFATNRRRFALPAKNSTPSRAAAVRRPFPINAND